MKRLLICLLALFSTLAYAGDAVLYSFQGAPDGQLPLAGMASDSAGNLYGTTNKGGSGPCTSSGGNGCGTIFKVSSSGNGWTETVLYRFQGKNDGRYPIAGLAIDPDGNLYGGTPGTVGVGSCPPACGNVFEFSSAGVFTVLHRFTGGLDGTLPTTGLAIDSSGRLYGTTDGTGHGTVFQLSNSSGKWKLTTLYAFMGGTDGGDPTGTPLLGPDGSLYGGAALGGTGGVIYRVYKTKAWHEKVIYFFGTHGEPRDNLAFDATGNIYGVTEGDIVYQLSRGKYGKWSEKVLHHMNDTRRHNDGSGVRGGVAIDAAGNIYGVTVSGGDGLGTVYTISFDGTKWNESILYNFQGGEDGGSPTGQIILGVDGNLYGVTQGGGSSGCGNGGCGTVFKIAP
jgi:hypothetical protein